MMTSPATARRTLTLVRTGGPPRGSVELEVLAREAGMHPELVKRLVRLGLLDAVAPSAGTTLFPRDAARLLARAARLRQDLGLNYAGAVLACQLLARIEALEARLRRYEDHDERPR
jgi:hypothetical protein